ncbi:transposase [Kitasatospora mediocidica]|uniref:transposase n=1 Tax=Kitasatospora mediocidica TaxID=58352 RepID=UPI000B163EE5|nr:transposase [Kitasatospora mediocidica]
MTDAEWAVVRDAMPVPAWLEGRGGQPEGYCHRQLVDAVRYLVAGGIAWRAVPADFPAWDRVYAFFRRWRDTGLVTEFHDRLRDRVRRAAGRDPEPTAGIIDAQSERGGEPVCSSMTGSFRVVAVSGWPAAGSQRRVRLVVEVRSAVGDRIAGSPGGAGPGGSGVLAGDAA